jgi:hypothetical protein
VEMSGPKHAAAREHRHTAVTTHAIRQQAGVPYEVERKVCTTCERVLDEKPVKRALAA